MSAFHRRTLFAAPLILSITTGCSSKADEPMRALGSADLYNPPSPEGPRFAREWDVRRDAPGECRAAVVESCPPNALCNPPKPRAVECPPGTSGKTVIRIVELPDKTCGILAKGCLAPECVKIKTPCPLPSGAKLPERILEWWTVEKNKNGDGGCHAEEPGECPPGVDCNPPSPHKIACPPGVTETTTIKVALLKDKTCAVMPDDCKAPACTTTKTPCPVD